MGGFLVECTLCGISFRSERKYNAHPCMGDDVKVPFEIKMELDDEEAELEEKIQKMSDHDAVTCKEDPFTMTSIKKEPGDIELEDVNLLGKGQEDKMYEDKCQVMETISETDTPKTRKKGGEDSTELEATISESSLHECLICEEKFLKREDFLKHKMSSHKVSRPYECTVCKVRFTQKHFVDLHMRIHTGKLPYKCSLCSSAYTHKTNFTIHMRVHNGERPFRCTLCEKKCYTKLGLTNHMRTHGKETPYKCEVCEKRFTEMKSLMLHRKNHIGEVTYKCQYCGKTFHHRNKHKIHVRLHTGEKPCKCKICGKEFTRHDELKRHILSHQGIKRFKCSICNVYCATRSYLMGHIDLHHSDLKPDNPILPKKTNKKSSNEILVMKLPHPRTIYKPVTSVVPDNESLNCTTVPISLEGKSVIIAEKGIDRKPKMSYKEYIELQEKILVEKGLKVKSPKAKSLKQGSYKEYIELQEKILVEKGLKVKNPKAKSLNQGSYKEYIEFQEKMLVEKGLKVKNSKAKCFNQVLVPVANDNASKSKQGTSISENQGVVSVSGKQAMDVPFPTVQSGSCFSLIVTKQLSPAASVRMNSTSIVPNSSSHPSVVIPQTQLLGGQGLGGQQLILLTASGNQQSSCDVSQRLLLTAGADGVGAQRLVLLPKQASGPAVNGVQMVMIPNNVANMGEVSTVTPDVGNNTAWVKQEVIEPSLVIKEENVLKAGIKQEPSIHLSTGIVVKEESKKEESSSAQ